MNNLPFLLQILLKGEGSNHVPICVEFQVLTLGKSSALDRLEWLLTLSETQSQRQLAIFQLREFSDGRDYLSIGQNTVPV